MAIKNNELLCLCMVLENVCKYLTGPFELLSVYHSLRMALLCQPDLSVQSLKWDRLGRSISHNLLLKGSNGEIKYNSLSEQSKVTLFRSQCMLALTMMQP